MNTLSENYHNTLLQLKNLYDDREAKGITNELFLRILHLKPYQIITQSKEILTQRQIVSLQSATAKLLLGTPIQYVTGICTFSEMDFIVNPSVLIPRPETEELVRWIINEHNDNQPITILDIGTGSGCIAISLAKNLLNSKILALDFSEPALETAQLNAKQLNCNNIEFVLADIFTLPNTQYSDIDVMLSNPPYIPYNERDTLAKNVRDFEPQTALFVQDNHPILFYKKIAVLAKTYLKSEGKLFFEINPPYADAICELLSELNYKEIQVKKDIHNKNRMICAKTTKQ